VGPRGGALWRAGRGGGRGREGDAGHAPLPSSRPRVVRLLSLHTHPRTSRVALYSVPVGDLLPLPPTPTHLRVALDLDTRWRSSPWCPGRRAPGGCRRTCARRRPPRGAPGTAADGGRGANGACRLPRPHSEAPRTHQHVCDAALVERQGRRALGPRSPRPWRAPRPPGRGCGPAARAAAPGCGGWRGQKTLMLIHNVCRRYNQTEPIFTGTPGPVSRVLCPTPVLRIERPWWS